MIKKRRRRREKKIYTQGISLYHFLLFPLASGNPHQEPRGLVLTPSSSSSWLLSCTHKPLPGACCSQKWSDIHCDLSLECTIQKNLKGLYNNSFHFQSGLEEFFFFYIEVVTRGYGSFSANVSPAICYFSFFHYCETEKEDNFLYRKRRCSEHPSRCKG